MLISMNDILQPTREYRFAIGAFNVVDSCFIHAVVEEAEVTHTPAIISIHSSEHDFVTDTFSPMYAKERQKVQCPLSCIWITAPSLNMCNVPFNVDSRR